MEILAIVVLGISAGILGVTATVVGIRLGKVSGQNEVLRADSQKHAAQLQAVEDKNKDRVARLQNVIAGKEQDLKDAEDQLDEMRVAIDEGRIDDAKRIGGSLADWLTTPADGTNVVTASSSGGETHSTSYSSGVSEAFLPICVLSLFLGAVMLRTQRLAAAWFLHALYNGAMMLYMLLERMVDSA